MFQLFFEHIVDCNVDISGLDNDRAKVAICRMSLVFVLEVVKLSNCLLRFVALSASPSVKRKVGSFPVICFGLDLSWSLESFPIWSHLCRQVRWAIGVADHFLLICSGLGQWYLYDNLFVLLSYLCDLVLWAGWPLNLCGYGASYSLAYDL